jgi:hypothetical protein
MRIPAVVVVAALLGVASGPGYTQRLEVRTVETVTLTAQQVLTGEGAWRLWHRSSDR